MLETKLLGVPLFVYLIVLLQIAIVSFAYPAFVNAFKKNDDLSFNDTIIPVFIINLINVIFDVSVHAKAFLIVFTLGFGLIWLIFLDLILVLILNSILSKRAKIWWFRSFWYLTLSTIIVYVVSYIISLILGFDLKM